jgi:hypothetical protein
MSETSDRSLHTSSPPGVFSFPRVLSHTTSTLARLSVLAALVASCGGETGTGPIGFSDTSSTSSGAITQDACDSQQDCVDTLADYDYLSADCVTVSCSEGQCRFDNTSFNGGTCDDGELCTTGDICNNGGCSGVARDCDDEDPCTADLCVPETGGCDYPIALGNSCDDGLSCTNEDSCDATGACTGDPSEACECVGDEDCDDLNPEDRCEGLFACQGDYTCAFDITKTVVCSEALSSDCTLGECVPETGECVSTPISDGEVCTAVDDPCIDAGLCDDAGACLGPEIDCDDGDPCTIDSCDRDAGGCVHEVNQGASCDDADTCTTEDACLADGSCLGTPVSCVDDNTCTEGSCDAETGDCVYAPIEGACNDQLPCTVGDACLEGVCTGALKDCDDGNTCTDDQCVTSTGKCASVAVLDLNPCSLEDPCTEADFCLSGACTAGPSICECELDEECAAYNNDDPCSPDYYCGIDVFPIVCTPDMSSVPTCEESEHPCLQNICVSETGECGLVEQQDGLQCDDGDSCSVDGFCFDGSCTTTPVDCEDGNPCTANLCNDTGCYTKLLDESEQLLQATFDQGYPEGWTTETDNPDIIWAPSGAYAAGEGGLGMVVTGPNGNYDGPVEAWLRSPWFHVYGEQLELRYKVRTALAQSGCGADALQVGIQAFGIFTPLQLICQTQTEWTDQVVDLSAYRNLRVQLAFRFLANDTQNAGFGAAIDAIEIDALFSCIDSDICTTGETCQEGSCELAAVSCNDGDPCTADACSPDTGCVHIPQDICVCEIASDCPFLGACAVPSCVDGVCEAINIDGACDTEDACSTDGQCSEGVCVGQVLICHDDDPCTSDLCNSEVGCQFPPHNEPCDDGDLCTINDACMEGACVGTAKPCDTGNPCAMGMCQEGECWAEPLHDGQVLIGDDFDGIASLGIPPYWTQEQSHPAWAWSANTESSSSAPNAVALTGPTDWDEEPVVLRLKTPEFNIPADGASLRFMLSMAVGDEGCDEDTLTVTVGQAQLTIACESTVGWVQIDLPIAPVTGPVIAQFEASIAAETASAVDIRLDDIEVLANYPCPTDAPCFDGVCVVGSCMTQPILGCE